ncbi:phosphoglucosamine mutase [Acidothermaceae bacterium B102]|nr:phosphoglucosamine mutase [Acidothermaceae bacterium B102]
MPDPGSGARLFGTDGVRGLANADLTPELALGIAVAAAHVLVESRDGGVAAARARGTRPVAVVGRDPRASGEFLEAAVTAGLASAGLDVIRVGVIPTPGVAYLTQTLRADLGVTISASHNAMPDNGIKLFDRFGYKLPDEVEEQIENRMGEPWQRPTGGGVGRVYDDPQAVVRYIDHLVGCAPARLDGLRVVVDCAHGSASAVAPEVYRRLGARVHTLGAEPNGLNINDDIGSTHPEQLQKMVVDLSADLGIAHDGDADRCLAVDADGLLVDGDQILAICALALRDAGQLTDGTVVSTVMANLGFKLAMAEQGIQLVETAVGDRYVLEAMLRDGFVLGGEQSGHVLFTRHATTGDGTLTAVQLMGRMAGTGLPLGELAAVMTRLPQLLINVRVADKSKADSSAELTAAIAEAEARLGPSGRVLVRPSGTEPIVRVMVEATDQVAARDIAEGLAAVVATALA